MLKRCCSIKDRELEIGPAFYDVIYVLSTCLLPNYMLSISIHIMFYYFTSFDCLCFVSDMLRSIIATCCLGCNKVNFVGNKSYLTKFLDKNASVIMPVETSKSSTQFFGRDFVYFLEVPGVSFLLKPKRPGASELTADLFKSVLSTWPLFITALLMAIIAGIAIWMMVITYK